MSELMPGSHLQELSDEVSLNKQQRLKEKGRRESEKEMSGTGQDAAGRKYSARNYVVGTRQRILLFPRL